MSMLNKVIAAVTPTESDGARAEARQKAHAAATTCGWLALVLEHHLEIEQGFAAVAGASDADGRRDAQGELAALLTAHAIAEEGVIYPAMSHSGEAGHAEKAYAEQSEAKVQMAALDDLDPMSQEYLDKLEHIRAAVAHHVYEEEGIWFPELLRSQSDDQEAKLTARYLEEVSRYLGHSTPFAEA